MRIQELIKQIGQQNVISIRQDISLQQVTQYLSEYSIGALPVVDAENNVVGIISERDIITTIASESTGFFSKKVFEVMTTNVSTCGVDDLADDIYRVLCDNNIRHIPVVKFNKLQAMLSIRDFDKVHDAVTRQSLTDKLTGLYNLRHCRTLVDGEFNQFRRFHSPFSLATIIVDDYHKHMETEGFHVLDAALKKLGSLLNNVTRSFDHIGRIDEDQLLIIFHKSDRKAAVRACERIVQTIADELPKMENGTNFTVSVGLAISNENDRNGEGILKRAIMLADDAKPISGNSIMIEESNNIAKFGAEAQSSDRAFAS